MPAPTSNRKSLPHGLPFAPTKVGVLIDIDMGTKEDFLATLRFGFDEAHAEGVITRPVELVVKEAIGLPRLEAKNTIDGYLALAAEGVLCVIGPLITDNSIALAPVIDRTGVPAVTWTGTDRYHGQYCFNLGNGGLAEEAAIMAAWIRRRGYTTVGMIHEISPGGVEYASNLRDFADHLGKRRDHTVTALSYDTTRLIAEGLARAPLLTPAGVKDGLERVRMLPAVNGGPRTHMSLGPYDHKAYKGDWLVIRRIEGGRTVFVGL